MDAHEHRNRDTDVNAASNIDANAMRRPVPDGYNHEHANEHTHNRPDQHSYPGSARHPAGRAGNTERAPDGRIHL